MPFFRILICSLLLISVTPAIAQQIPAKTTAAVRRGCVEIHVAGQLRGGGAFVKDKSGGIYVITAAHLFKNRKVKCRVLTENDTFLLAHIKAYDLGFDLALLELDTPVKSVLPIKIADRIPTESAPLFNFGPALNRRTLVISGHVADSRISYTDFSPADGYLGHFFVAGISPVLTSGGIWVNTKGQIVGIQNGRLKGDPGAPSSGLSMAAPPQAISFLLETKKPSSTPGIGGWVWELWTADQKIISKLPKGTEGIIVTRVKENGPLAFAGVKKNDVITQCNGDKIKRHHQFIEMIRSQPAGSVFRLKIVSPGQKPARIVQMKTNRLEAQWE